MRAPAKPRAISVQPPTGPTVHAKPIRAPGKRDPRWYWRCTVYQDGDERTVWTGRGTPDEVRAEVWQLIGRGEHVAAAPDLAEDEVIVRTVADLLALWRGHLDAERTDLAESTRKLYLTVSRVVEEVLGSTMVEVLSRADVDRYRAIVTRPPGDGARRRTARSTSGLHLDMVVLGQAWAWGRSIGACPDRDLSLPRIDVRRVKERYTPTAGEVSQVVQLAEPWARDLLELQWATGARIGELLELRARDVDLERAAIVVGRHAGAQKTGTRRVPVNPDTLPLLRRMAAGKAHDARLCTYGVTQGTLKLNAMIAEACDALGIPPWTTHALRRAFVVRAVRAGVDVATLATITGHSVKELLTTYREVQDEDRQAAVKLLPGRLPAGEVRPFRARDPHR